MTEQRKKILEKVANAQLKAENQEQIKKILTPIYKKIEVILQEKSFKKLERLATNLAKRLNA